MKTKEEQECRESPQHKDTDGEVIVRMTSSCSNQPGVSHVAGAELTQGVDVGGNIWRPAALSSPREVQGPSSPPGHKLSMSTFKCLETGCMHHR